MIIYALIDPRTDALRYIGQTIQPLERRYKAHLDGAKNSGNPTRNVAWIKSLATQGLRPDVAVVEFVNDDLDEREMFWIAWFKARGEDLNNHTPGGDGVRLDAEAMARRSASLREACAKPRTPKQLEQIARMHASNSARERTPAELDAIARSAAMRTGRPLSAEHRAAVSAGRTGVPTTKTDKFLAGKQRAAETRRNRETRESETQAARYANQVRAHRRWHVNRNICKIGCELCMDGVGFIDSVQDNPDRVY